MAVGKALDGVRLVDGAPLPDWVGRFTGLIDAAHAAVRAYQRDPASVDRRFVEAAQPIAFEMIVAPLVIAASQRLHAATAWPIGPAARAGFERALLLRLARLCGPVLELEWRAFAQEHPLAETSELTRAFAERLWSASLPPLFEDYPVLARLVTLVCDHWADATRELLGRIEADRASLATVFNGGRDPGPLADVTFGDADLHDGHRIVVILHFAAGCRIVYKPRPLAIDAAFARLIADVNHAGLTHPLRSPAAWCGDGYGYAEFIEHRPCVDEEALARFYHRMGALAALAAALGSTDLHCGNVIACGDVPVVIDLETMLSADLRIGLPDPPSTPEAPSMPETTGFPPAATTMLLPAWRTQRGAVLDHSALAPGPDPAALDPLSLPCAAHELEATLRRHGGAVVAGAEEMSRLLAPTASPLDAGVGAAAPRAFEGGAAIRMVVRDTRTYMAILRQSIEPACLRDGVDRAIALERLHHIVGAGDQLALAPLVVRERRSMLDLDVPRFMMACSATDLTDGRACVVAGAAATPPLARARQRIGALDAGERERQSRYIRAAIAARLAPAASNAPRVAVESRTPITAGDLIARAITIAEHTWTRAAGSGATVPREGLSFRSREDRWGWTIGDAGLAHGAIGDALLFAAVASATGDERWRERARETAEQVWPVTVALLSASPRPYLPWLGLESGVGGQLCAAALLTHCLGRSIVDASLLDTVAAFTPAPDSRADAAGGVAGLRFGMLALERSLGDARLAQVAERCGDFLARAGGASRADRFPGLSGEAVTIIHWADAPTPLREATLPPMDSYRFGTAGEIDALLWAGRQSGRADAIAAAERLGAAAIARADAAGWRLLPDDHDADLTIDGLFDGLPGVAYALLRLAAPDRVPSLAAAMLGEAARCE